MQDAYKNSFPQLAKQIFIKSQTFGQNILNTKLKPWWWCKVQLEFSSACFVDVKFLEILHRKTNFVSPFQRRLEIQNCFPRQKFQTMAQSNYIWPIYMWTKALHSPCHQIVLTKNETERIVHNRSQNFDFIFPNSQRYYKAKHLVQYQSPLEQVLSVQKTT